MLTRVFNERVLSSGNPDTAQISVECEGFSLCFAQNFLSFQKSDPTDSQNMILLSIQIDPRHVSDTHFDFRFLLFRKKKCSPKSYQGIKS